MDPINTQNSSGMMNGMPPQPHQEKKVGPIVGALIIILVLIIAALYFFGQKLNTGAPVESAPIVETQSPEAPAATADDVDTLQAELGASLQDVDYSF
jgi:hypothetical protein